MALDQEPQLIPHLGGLGAVSVRVAGIVDDETLAPVCAADYTRPRLEDTTQN